MYWKVFLKGHIKHFQWSERQAGEIVVDKDKQIERFRKRQRTVRCSKLTSPPPKKRDNKDDEKDQRKSDLQGGWRMRDRKRQDPLRVPCIMADCHTSQQSVCLSIQRPSIHPNPSTHSSSMNHTGCMLIQSESFSCALVTCPHCLPGCAVNSQCSGPTNSD